MLSAQCGMSGERMDLHMGLCCEMAAAAAKNMDHHLSGDAYRADEGERTESQQVDMLAGARSAAAKDEADRRAAQAGTTGLIEKMGTMFGRGTASPKAPSGPSMG